MLNQYSINSKNYVESVNQLGWNQRFYLKLEKEVHPFNEPDLFRPLDKAYNGSITFWSTPSPEPNLTDDFWNKVINSLSDKKNELYSYFFNLALSILRWQPEPEKILFVSILRAGVPITEWLCNMLPGSHGVALSLFVGIGIDKAALNAVEQDFPDRSIIFVDGWTGKGGVAREIAKLNRGPLAVLIDPWGWADFAGIKDDVFCPSACFTGVATLGFSRTFFADPEILFSAYPFSCEFLSDKIVKKWKKFSPDALNQNKIRAERGVIETDNLKKENIDALPEKFYADTPLRVHSNEVCRALINAAPKIIMFVDNKIDAQRNFPLLIELAQHRNIDLKFNVTHLKELKTRVACRTI